jgi:biotin carboxyl carrier protein
MSDELISASGDTAVVGVSSDTMSVTVDGADETFSIDWDGVAEGRVCTGARSQRFFAHRRGDEVEIWFNGEVYRIGKVASGARKFRADATASGDVTASMPGVVVRVLAADGDTVVEGDGIVVLESMKMQLTLSAPRAGVVRSLTAVQGTMVEQGEVLARIEVEDQV